MKQSKQNLQAREYEKALKNAKIDKQETLTTEEHKLLMKGYQSSSMRKIYDNLGDLERTDLIDFFNIERNDGSDI